MNKSPIHIKKKGNTQTCHKKESGEPRIVEPKLKKK